MRVFRFGSLVTTAIFEEMGTTEANELKKAAYAEALRYMQNARETYKKARKEDRFYKDAKYVRGGADYACHAVLIVLDACLKLKGVSEPQQKSIEYYPSEVSKLDKKMLVRLNDAYQTLHLAGSYDGNLNVEVNAAGLRTAEEIIEAIRP
jgi:hypothetical protein